MSDEARRGERLISAVLRGGVLASLVAVVLGTLVSFAHHPSYLTSASELAPLTHPGQAPSSLAAVCRGLAAGRGQALVAAGLLVLIATPVARVLLSIGLFCRQRDRVFVTITTGVLALLALSFVLGATAG